MAVDVLAIGAHPDDVDMTVGGTLAKLVSRGKSVAIVDLTRGEMGSTGSAELRLEEAQCAAKILGACERVTLDLGDGLLENNAESRRQVIEVIRRFRPQLVLANHWEDLHTDHAVAGQIMRAIIYSVGFLNFPAAGEPFRPNEILFFMSHTPFEPSFIVDITGFHEKKLEAVRCFRSQLQPQGNPGIPPSSPPDAFLRKLESRARYFGNLIDREFGEPLLAIRPVPMVDPVDHYAPFAKTTPVRT
jgi:bacillithiol biosynthesis deacetylase BshB1